MIKQDPPMQNFPTTYRHPSLLLALLLLTIFVTPQASADRQSDFQAAYSAYQQAIEAGDNERALATAAESYRLGSKLYGKTSINTANLAINYAMLLNDTGDFKRARKVLKGKLPVLEERHGKDSGELVTALIQLGRANFDMKKPEEGLAYFDRAVILLEQEEMLYRGQQNFDIAALLLRRGANVHTRKYIQAAHDAYVEKLQPHDVRRGLTSYHMALWSLGDRNFRAAVTYLDAALLAFKTDDGQMGDIERAVRKILIEVHESNQASDLATPHLQAVGRTGTWRPEAGPLYMSSSPDNAAVLADNAMAGEVTLAFTVDHQGFVREPKVEISSGPLLSEAALSIIRSARYAPRHENGKAVSTDGVKYSMSFDFTKPKSSNFSRPGLRGFENGGGSGAGTDMPDFGGGGGKGGGGSK
jgi:TonB family protein